MCSNDTLENTPLAVATEHTSALVTVMSDTLQQPTIRYVSETVATTDTATQECSSLERKFSMCVDMDNNNDVGHDVSPHCSVEPEIYIPSENNSGDMDNNLDVGHDVPPQCSVGSEIYIPSEHIPDDGVSNVNDADILKCVDVIELPVSSMHSPGRTVLQALMSCDGNNSLVIPIKPHSGSDSDDITTMEVGCSLHDMERTTDADTGENQDKITQRSCHVSFSSPLVAEYYDYDSPSSSGSTIILDPEEPASIYPYLISEKYCDEINERFISDDTNGEFDQSCTSVDEVKVTIHSDPNADLTAKSWVLESETDMRSQSCRSQRATDVIRNVSALENEVIVHPCQIGTDLGKISQSECKMMDDTCISEVKATDIGQYSCSIEGEMVKIERNKPDTNVKVIDKSNHSETEAEEMDSPISGSEATVIDKYMQSAANAKVIDQYIQFEDTVINTSSTQSEANIDSPISGSEVTVIDKYINSAADAKVIDQCIQLEDKVIYTSSTQSEADDKVIDQLMQPEHEVIAKPITVTTQNYANDESTLFSIQNEFVEKPCELDVDNEEVKGRVCSHGEETCLTSSKEESYFDNQFSPTETDGKIIYAVSETISKMLDQVCVSESTEEIVLFNQSYGGARQVDRCKQSEYLELKVKDQPSQSEGALKDQYSQSGSTMTNLPCQSEATVMDQSNQLECDSISAIQSCESEVVVMDQSYHPDYVDKMFHSSQSEVDMYI